MRSTKSAEKKNITPEVESREEQIKLEYATLMEEYRALRDELVSTLESARQVTNYTLILVTALVAASSLISNYLVQTESGSVLLIIPAIFYLFAWAALRYTILTAWLSDYIRQNIAPKVRDCISKLSPTTPVDQSLFTWEEKGKNTLSKYGLFYFPIAGAHFGLPLLGAIFLIGFYIVLVRANQLTPSILDIILIVINAFCLVYSAYWGLRVERSR